MKWGGSQCEQIRRIYFNSKCLQQVKLEKENGIKQKTVMNMVDTVQRHISVYYGL